MSSIKESRKEKIEELLGTPELLLQKNPFVRKGTLVKKDDNEVKKNSAKRVKIPERTYKEISQQDYLDELNPYTHQVLFDENVPHICVKSGEAGKIIEIEYKKMAIPFQVNIKDKKVLHLCGNPTEFTMLKKAPSDEETDLFLKFKEYWVLRNQEGMKTKFVNAQKSMGDAGLLYYFDYNGEIKSRILSYEDGYVICSHNDRNGDRLIESVYSIGEDNKEVIDSWDNVNHYRHEHIDNSDDSKATNDWTLVFTEPHGFSEIPLITHRGEVAWERAQSIIETYEIMYNIFTVIQKRHGWGILYIKGNFKATDQTVAGAIILNNTDPEGNGSADFKTPNNPEHMIEYMKDLRYEIQTAGGATFILPQDIKMSGDVSAIAIQLSQSLDNEEALKGVSEYQNVASKMCRLFKEGMAKELVNKGINTQAVTKYESLLINAKFVVWMPKSDSEYNQMLATMKGAGLISKKTGIEKNTQSKPDEENRIKTEELEAEEKAAKLAEQTATIAAVNSTTDNTSTSTDTTSLNEE